MKKELTIGIIVAVVLIVVIAGYFILQNKQKQSIYICGDGSEVSNPNDCLAKGGIIQQNKGGSDYGEVYGNLPSANTSQQNSAKHAKVEITSHNIQSREGELSHTIYKTIVGEIMNTGDRTANGVKIIATLYDVNNQIVGTEYTYAEISDLKVGQVSPFKIADISTTFQTYKLQADWSEYSWEE